MRAAYLPKLYRGDLVMCQLFSEPNAGSDLAAAATRAVRDGDEWVVNGQKVWTSSAHVADLALAVCRTDPDVPKHQGITTFLVDMHAPGVEVRPLRQMTGTAGFNEVFLTDVRVPDSHRVGDLNAGFRRDPHHARQRADHRHAGAVGRRRHRAVRAAPRGRRHFGDRADPHQRQRLAQLYIGDRVKQLLIERWRASLRPGVTPGPEMSVLKLHSCRHNAELVTMLTEVLGPRLAADTGEWGSFAWTEFVLSTPGARIGGGTEEIVRNTVAEKVLGLPKEPKGVGRRRRASTAERRWLPAPRSTSPAASGHLAADRGLRHLARRRLRQLVGDVERLGALEPGQPCRSRTRGGRRGRTSAPGSGHDDGAHPLAHRPFVEPDDRDLGDGRVLVQHGFDLDAVHVLAAADDDVLHPVDDVDEAVVVDVADVAGVEPAVAERCRRRLPRRSSSP